MTKKLSLLSLAGVAAMSLTACGGGSSSNDGDTVSGNLADGAAQSGVSVTIYQVDASGNETVVDTSTVSGNDGTYSEDNVSVLNAATGLMKLRAVGSFLNDGGSSGSTIDSTVDVYWFMDASDGVHVVHSNVLTHLAAAVLADSSADGNSQYDPAALATANSTALNFLGIDSSGDASISDPRYLNIGKGTSGASTAYTTASTKLLVFTAAMANIYSDSTYGLSSTYANLGELIASMVTDIKEGKRPFETAAGKATSGSGAFAAFQGKLESYGANPGSINLPTELAASSGTLLDATTDMASVFQLQGFACGSSKSQSASGTGRNGVMMTYGSAGSSYANASYDASGNVNTISGLTNASADQITFRCPIRAFTSADTTTDVGGGTTPVGASADSWTGSFSVYVASTTTTTESVLATFDEVTMTIGDATTGRDSNHLTNDGEAVPTSLTVSVPTSAGIAISYTDSSGNDQTANYTNSASAWNFLDASGSGEYDGTSNSGAVIDNKPELVVNLGKLLRTINATLTDATLADFSVSGTYDVYMGFGIPVSFEDATADGTQGIKNKLPGNTKVNNSRALFFNDLSISSSAN